MVNALSIDVEEYFHAENLSSVAPRSSWPNLPSRVVQTTEKVLEILRNHQTKATFFILGTVGEQFPELIRSIHSEGHELASHGYDHKLVYHLSEAEFREDINKAKDIVESAAGVRIKGYRAPNFSITDRTPWAYESLIAAGFEYDSSLHPVWHPRYSNLGKPRAPYRLTLPSGSLDVIPLSSVALLPCFPKFRISVAGGAYWRLLPKKYIEWGMRRVMTQDSLPLNCYFHPWEIDGDQPRFDSLGKLTEIRHYGRIPAFIHRLNRYLKKFSFSTVDALRTSYFGEE